MHRYIRGLMVFVGFGVLSVVAGRVRGEASDWRLDIVGIPRTALRNQVLTAELNFSNIGRATRIICIREARYSIRAPDTSVQAGGLWPVSDHQCDLISSIHEIAPGGLGKAYGSVVMPPKTSGRMVVRITAWLRIMCHDANDECREETLTLDSDPIEVLVAKK